MNPLNIPFSNEWVERKHQIKDGHEDGSKHELVKGRQHGKSNIVVDYG